MIHVETFTKLEFFNYLVLINKDPGSTSFQTVTPSFGSAPEI